MAIDGRTARAVRTRAALLDATTALIEEGDLRPTAPRIAERAGVSVRSVFQHFEDLETLFSELGDRVRDRVLVMVEPVDPTHPLAERVNHFVRQRCQINEFLNPFNRAAILQAPTSPTIRAKFIQGHDLASEYVRASFAPELESVGEFAQPFFDGLRFATAWTTWHMCRVIEGHSVEVSEDEVRRVVGLVFRGAGLDVGMTPGSTE